MTTKYAEIDDVVYFWFAANDTSGSGADGASSAVDVRLGGAAAGAAPVHSPTATLLSHADYPAGLYEIAITLSAANGYAADNQYAVFSTLLVDSQNPSGFIGAVNTKPVQANVLQIGSDAQSATDFKDFADAGDDPATNKVQGVVLVDTLTTYTGNTPQTADHTAAIADIPTVAEFNARTLPSASYFDPTADTVANVTTVATLSGHTPQTADHTAAIADIPTVAEFNARTLASASYFDPAADTVANVTTVGDVTTKTGYSLSTAGILAIWHQLTSAIVTAGTIGKLLVDNIDAAITTAATATGFATEAKQDAQDLIITEARLSELDAGTGGKMANQVDVIQTDTTTDIPATIAALPTAAENATATFTTAMTESYSTKNGTMTLAQSLYELVQHMQTQAVADTTWTVYKRDGSTPAFTMTLDANPDPTTSDRAT